MRVKSNTIIEGKLAHQQRSTRKKKTAYRPSKVWKLNVSFACKAITCKGKRDEKLYVISNCFIGPEMLDLYKQGWGIELLFSHLKKRGFNLEDTHMTQTAKIQKLLSVNKQVPSNVKVTFASASRIF